MRVFLSENRYPLFGNTREASSRVVTPRRFCEAVRLWGGSLSVRGVLSIVAIRSGPDGGFFVARIGTLAAGQRFMRGVFRFGGFARTN